MLMEGVTMDLGQEAPSVARQGSQGPRRATLEEHREAAQGMAPARGGRPPSAALSQWPRPSALALRRGKPAPHGHCDRDHPLSFARETADLTPYAAAHHGDASPAVGR